MKLLTAALSLMMLLSISAAPVHAQVTGDLSLREVAAIAPYADLRDRAMVRTIQRSLRQHGLYGGAIDGIAGPRTLAGIRMSQQLVSPWIVPVIQMDLSRAVQGRILSTGPIYVTPPVAQMPYGAPILAPVAPWRLQGLMTHGARVD